MKMQNSKIKTWRKVKLRETLEITSSKRIFMSEYKTSGVPFYRGKEIIEKHNGAREISTPLYISEEKFYEIKNKFGAPKENDILLTSVGTLGVPYLVKKDEKFYFKDGNLTWFRNYSNNVNPKFIYYWLTSPVGKHSILTSSIGSSQQAFTIDGLKKIEINLPENIGEQKRIADILSAFDEKIELNNKINQNLEQTAQAIFKEWFVKFRFPKWKKVKFVKSELGKIPEGWEVKKLGEIVKIEYGRGPSTKELKKSGYPVYGANGIIGHYEKYDFEESQIIIGCRGVVGSLFRTLPKSSITHNSLIIKPAFFEKDYLFLLLKNSNLQSVAGGSAQPQITIKELSQLPVLFAEDKLRERFEKIVKNLEQKRLNIIYENQTLSSLRDLLLPKLMSGEIRIKTWDTLEQDKI